MKNVSLSLLIVLYTLAGVNHFWHPEFYLKIIPPYFHDPLMINYLAGVSEFILGVMMISKRTRYVGACGIVLMLMAFIPAHVYYLQINPCSKPSCPSFWLGWVRLLVGQPLLIAWAWKCRK